MNFDFSDDQKFLKDQARKFLSDQCPADLVREVHKDEARTHDAGLWEKVKEMGWLGAAIPEAYGGLGLGHLELCVIAEEFGRACAPIPFASSAYFAAEALMLAGSEDQKQRLLPKLASGEAVGAFALSEGPGAPAQSSIDTTFDGSALTGQKIPVMDGDLADILIVVAREGDAISLTVAELGEAATRESLSTLESARGHARLVFDKQPAERLGAAGEGWDLARRVQERAAVLIAFEQVGGADRALEMARDYALERFAFARPIGGYQGIKHKLADIYVKNQIARSNAYFGAWALNTDASDLPIAAAQARIAASDAFSFAAKENIQTHGGMGFTYEADPHLYYRRAKLLAVCCGAPKTWKERLVTQLENRNAA